MPTLHNLDRYLEEYIRADFSLRLGCMLERPVSEGVRCLSMKGLGTSFL